jgi:hypothetical protein
MSNTGGPPRSDRKRWLIVEGSDDKFVTVELLARHGAFWGSPALEADLDLPYIHDAQGIDKLHKVVAVQAKSQHRFGMIIDADLDASKAWSKLRKLLRAISDPPEWLAKLLAQLPESLPKEGVVVEQGERALGIWVMPDNGARGALEHFLVNLVPAGDVHWEPARDSVAAAQARGVAFSEQHRSKAEIHTWLAWQQEPGVPFGRAMKSSYFIHDAVAAMAFISWFRRMFPEGQKSTQAAKQD